MVKFYSNRNFSDLYQYYFDRFHWVATAENVAQIVLPKSQQLKNWHSSKELLQAKSFVGLPNSLQMAAKDLFWFHLRKYYGEEEAARLSPCTILISSEKARMTLENWLDQDGRVVLKNNRQRRKGIKFIKSSSELENTDLTGFVIGQRWLEQELINEQWLCTLRYYLAVVSINGELQFFLFPHGKILYGDPKEGWTMPAKRPEELKSVLEKGQMLTDKTSAYKEVKEKILQTCQAFRSVLAKNLSQERDYFDLLGVDLFPGKKGMRVLEINRSPSMIPTDEEDRALKKEVLKTFLTSVEKSSQLSDPWDLLG